MSKKTKIKEKALIKKGESKGKKSKIFKAIVSFLLSLITIILSLSAYDFSKKISPFTYSYSVEENITFNISNSVSSNANYNITPLKVNIKNATGDIDNISIAYLKDGILDIQSGEYKKEATFNFEKGLAVRLTYSGEFKNTKLEIRFNDFFTDCNGYFFIIFKSYSGDYYYNVLHYIKEDEKHYDESTGLYFIDVNTRFFRIQDIYNRSLMNELCTIINENSDSEIKVDDYIAKIEQDYNLIKSKIE